MQRKRSVRQKKQRIQRNISIKGIAYVPVLTAAAAVIVVAIISVSLSRSRQSASDNPADSNTTRSATVATETPGNKRGFGQINGRTQIMPTMIPTAPSNRQMPETIDDMFYRVALKYPEFGGVFVDDEKDILYIYLRGGDVQAVATELRAVFGENNLPHNPQALPAKYSFLELKRWHDLMVGDMFQIPGVNMTDIDDKENRLLVGAETQEARDQVKSKLAELSIPVEAVNIVEAGPVVLD